MLFNKGYKIGIVPPPMVPRIRAKSGQIPPNSANFCLSWAGVRSNWAQLGLEVVEERPAFAHV